MVIYCRITRAQQGSKSFHPVLLVDCPYWPEARQGGSWRRKMARLLHARRSISAFMKQRAAAVDSSINKPVCRVQ